MKAIEHYFHVVLFVFGQFGQMNFKTFPLFLYLALLGVKGLMR